MSSEEDSLHLFVPSTFVVPQKLPPGPPPVPGTVNPEDLRPPVDPPHPFLAPWKSFEEREQKTTGASIPVTMNKSELAVHCDRHDVSRTLEVVFKDRADCQEMIEDVLASLNDPFRGNEHSSIVWTFFPAVKLNPDREAKLGGKKLAKRHKILEGPPWSIVSYGTEESGIRRNLIYDGEGQAIAQVDFGHGSFIGIHVHALVQNNLQHAPGSSDEHCFELKAVPWPWVCAPDIRYSQCPAECGKELFGLPETLDTIQDDMKWIPITVPFEDYMGERAFSDEW